MDKDEEAGLRAFAMKVGASAASPTVQPESIERDGVRMLVAYIDASWREEERIGFRVTLADGASWLLYYVPELDLWSGVADVSAVSGAALE